MTIELSYSDDERFCVMETGGGREVPGIQRFCLERLGQSGKITAVRSRNTKRGKLGVSDTRPRGHSLVT